MTRRSKQASVTSQQEGPGKTGDILIQLSSRSFLLVHHDSHDNNQPIRRELQMFLLHRDRENLQYFECECGLRHPRVEQIA